MDYQLSVNELRVLGALMEKQITTPDQYPLTLKALMGACNQKSNRHPVLNLDEATVGELVAGLEAKYLISTRTEYGSRVTKHRQRFCNTEFGTLKFTPGELAVICVLMLRGPQTPGELRGRTSRMHAFANVDEVDETLEHLAGLDEPFVLRLAREPGRRESRYMHRLGDEPPEAAIEPEPVRVAAVAGPAADRIGELERSFADLSEQVADLRRRIEQQEDGQG